MRWLWLLGVAGVAGAEEAPKELRDFRGILHCHGWLSHDSKGTKEEIVAAAKAAKVDFIFMTDHPAKNSLTDALRGEVDGVFFISGAETDNILALDIREPLDARSPLDAVPQTVKRGGIALAAHPEEWKEDWWAAEGLAGMEIYNLHADVKDEGLEGVAKMLAAFHKDPETAILAIFDAPKDFLARWDAIGRSRRCVGVAANDAHQNQNLMGVQLDPYERVFRFVNTHLLARDLTRDGLREALTEGRAYVAFEIFGDAAGFRWWAEGPGGARLEMGSERKFAEGWSVKFELPSDASWKVLKDGETAANGEGKRGEAQVTGAGVWRLEARRKDGDGTWRPWVYGNPVYFR
jgi:histidinol phosphatase-like PHP family hydrolase